MGNFYLHRFKMDFWEFGEPVPGPWVVQTLVVGVPASSIQEQPKHQHPILRGLIPLKKTERCHFINKTDEKIKIKPVEENLFHSCSYTS